MTLDDVLLIPSYSEVLPKDVSLEIRLTHDIEPNIPLIPATMDTVIETRLTITTAQEDGTGIIHRNMDTEQQTVEVRKVKKRETAAVRNPVTVTPSTKIIELLRMAREYGFSGFPVAEQGELVGIVADRDLRVKPNASDTVATIMTPKGRLVTAHEGTPPEEMETKLHKSRIEKMLVVGENFYLRGLVTFRDIEKADTRPLAPKDEQDRLRIDAIVGIGVDIGKRVATLVTAGTDMVVVNAAHGHSEDVVERTRWVKQTFPDVQVISGNVATAKAIKAFTGAGIDAVKVGTNPGSIYATRIVADVGVSQVSAIANVVVTLKDTSIPLVADGGIRFLGDLTKTVVADTYYVMMGSMFTGIGGTPDEIELFQSRSYKSYRGMGSLGAISGSQGSSDRYFQDTPTGAEKLAPGGIEGRVPYKGTLSIIIHQPMGGLCTAMGYVDSADIRQMRAQPQLVRITGAGMAESHIHDIQITKEASNYRVGRGLLK